MEYDTVYDITDSQDTSGEKKAGSNEYEWSNIFNDGYVQQYFGPDSLMEYDTVYDITDSQDTSGLS